MIEFANKSFLPFELAPAVSVPLDATGDAYETPAEERATLGDLARLRYSSGVFRALIVTSAGDSSGVMTVALMAGAVEVGSADVEMAAGVTRYAVSVPVVLDAINGNTPLSAALSVGTAAAAGVTASVVAGVVVEHPVVIGGC